MISRSEKNKKVVQEINREKTIKVSKVMLMITLIISLIIVLLYLYVRFIGTGFIETNEFVIRDNRIPASMHGVKILHLSDLLYGSTIDKNDLDFLQEEITLINPQIIVFTGDIVYEDYTLSNDEINYLQDFFNEIEADLGKYAIYGDMDNINFTSIMNKTDFLVLNNEQVLVYNKENTPINLIGLNINEINHIEGVDNNYFTIGLIHNYDDYDKFMVKSDVILAGHNLGGEIRLPFTSGLLGDNQYNDEYYEVNGSKVHISNGLGSIHKMRFFNHPSINVYRLYNN